ncbi:outer membrane protein, partial [candidate division CSSED10-310 bacterium]
ISYRDEKSTDNVEIKDVEGEVKAETLAKSYPITGTLVFTLFAERTVPVNLMGGIGFYVYSFKFRPEGYSESSETDVRFGYHLGVGTEYPVSLGVKLEGSLKYLFLDLKDEYGDVLISEAHANAWMITLGLTFYF